MMEQYLKAYVDVSYSETESCRLSVPRRVGENKNSTRHQGKEAGRLCATPTPHRSRAGQGCRSWNSFTTNHMPVKPDMILSQATSTSPGKTIQVREATGCVTDQILVW